MLVATDRWDLRCRADDTIMVKWNRGCAHDTPQKICLCLWPEHNLVVVGCWLIKSAEFWSDTGRLEFNSHYEYLTFDCSSMSMSRLRQRSTSFIDGFGVAQAQADLRRAAMRHGPRDSKKIYIANVHVISTDAPRTELQVIKLVALVSPDSFGAVAAAPPHPRKKHLDSLMGP